MGESNTCCAWNVTTDGGKKPPTLTKLQYDATAGASLAGIYAAYQCAVCQGMVDAILREKYDPSAGWARGNHN